MHANPEIDESGGTVHSHTCISRGSGDMLLKILRFLCHERASGTI